MGRCSNIGLGISDMLYGTNHLGLKEESRKATRDLEDKRDKDSDDYYEERKAKAQKEESERRAVAVRASTNRKLYSDKIRRGSVHIDESGRAFKVTNRRGKLKCVNGIPVRTYL